MFCLFYIVMATQGAHLFGFSRVCAAVSINLEGKTLLGTQPRVLGGLTL